MRVRGSKPSYGRVSRYALVAFASSLDQIEPITKTVEDVALLPGTIADHSPADSTSLKEPVPDYLVGLENGVKGMRVRLPKEYVVEGIRPGIRLKVDARVRMGGGKVFWAIGGVWWCYLIGQSYAIDRERGKA